MLDLLSLWVVGIAFTAIPIYVVWRDHKRDHKHKSCNHKHER